MPDFNQELKGDLQEDLPEVPHTIKKPCYIVDKNMTDLVMGIWKQKKITGLHKNTRLRYAAFEACVTAITSASPVMEVEFELSPEEWDKMNGAVAQLTDEKMSDIVTKL